MTPRITPADGKAYALVAALAEGTPLELDGKPATFAGMTGYLITLKLGRGYVYLRAGNPCIAELARQIEEKPQ